MQDLRTRREAEAQEAASMEKAEELAGGNPLLNLRGAADFTVKRRWDDDVVFKNQARPYSCPPLSSSPGTVSSLKPHPTKNTQLIPRKVREVER